MAKQKSKTDSFFDLLTKSTEKFTDKLEKKINTTIEKNQHVFDKIDDVAGSVSDYLTKSADTLNSKYELQTGVYSLLQTGFTEANEAELSYNSLKITAAAKSRVNSIGHISRLYDLHKIKVSDADSLNDFTSGLVSGVQLIELGHKMNSDKDFTDRFALYRSSASELENGAHSSKEFVSKLAEKFIN